MTKINYAGMSDRDLKRYILTHRDDIQAFHAYRDRRHSRPQRTVVKFDDPVWEEKIVLADKAQLNSK